MVNYDMPIDEPSGKLDFKTYLQRISQTGRSSKRGIVVNFVHGQQRAMAIVKEIKDHLETILFLETENLEVWEEIERWLLE